MWKLLFFRDLYLNRPQAASWSFLWFDHFQVLADNCFHLLFYDFFNSTILRNFLKFFHSSVVAEENSVKNILDEDNKERMSICQSICSMSKADVGELLEEPLLLI